jgi:hypothetical protein
MPKSEFSKYIKENPSPKINMVYREFQDWKQTYKDGGGVSETPIAMMREVTGKPVGTVPVSETIYSSQVNDFVNYVYEVYAEKGYTKAQVKTAVNKYIKDLGKEFTYGGGDSVDRERVYEYLLNPSLKGIKNPMMRDGGGIYGEWSKEDLDEEFRYTNNRINNLSQRVRIAEDEIKEGLQESIYNKYANGGGVGNQGLLNNNYLDSIPAEKKAFILKGIAEHYGISVKKVLEEVTSSDAEELADYIMGRGALEVFNAMKSMKMTNGVGIERLNRRKG